VKIGYLLEQDVDVRQPPFDGPATHVREVVRELQRRGHTVRLLARLEGQLWCSDDLVTFTPVTVPVLDRGPLRLLESAVRRVQYELQLPYAAFFESQRFARACQQALASFDVLYERMSWFDYGGAIAARRLGLPLVLECNGDPLADLEAKGIAPRGWQRRISVTLMNRVVRQAAHIVVSGDGWRDAFLRRWAVDGASITTVENGTELLRLLVREQLRTFQDEAPDEQPVTIAYLGGFQPWQGVPILLRALARLGDEASQLRLVLVGSGQGEAQAQQLSRELGLSDVVTFTGRLAQEGYAPVLAQSDIGVAPYCDWPEYSGLKLFDYKAAGLAVIGSGENGYPRTLQHGRTGWIVPPCDEEALAAALRQLAQDGGLRRKLGRAARLEAESTHGWEHTTQRLEQIMTGVLREQEQVRRASENGRQGVRVT
jgi:glycosyltransferase involved in cell wall biosynthesis